MIRRKVAQGARGALGSGLDFGTIGSSLILASILVALILITKDRNGRQQAP
jgi:hypothetical protein